MVIINEKHLESHIAFAVLKNSRLEHNLPIQIVLKQKPEKL